MIAKKLDAIDELPRIFAVALVFLLGVVTIIAASTVRAVPRNTPSPVPIVMSPEASNILDLGNGWNSFCLDTSGFVAYEDKHGTYIITKVHTCGDEW